MKRSFLAGRSFRCLLDANQAASTGCSITQASACKGRRGEPLLAGAAIDRLAHDAHRIVITGESYRTRATRKRAAERKAGNEAGAEG